MHGSRALILDVVARHADLDEAPDQIAHVRIATVTRVGVGDDERPEVVLPGRGALLLSHVQALVLLVAVGGQQCPDQYRGIVGYLAQRVAGQVGSRVLGGRTLGGGCPTAEVDALDAHPLHAHRLPGRVWTEGGDALLGREELAQVRVESRRRITCDGVVGRDRAALLYYLARRVEANNPGKARVVEVPLRGGCLVLEVLFERCGDFSVRVDDGHGLRSSSSTIPLNVSLSPHPAVQSWVNRVITQPAKTVVTRRTPGFPDHRSGPAGPLAYLIGQDRAGSWPRGGVDLEPRNPLLRHP